MANSFSTQTQLTVNGKSYTIWSLSELGKLHDLSRLPFAHKILLENLLRNEDGEDITRDDIEALCNWDPAAQPATEIAFTPTRVVLQDFTGVPAVVDFAAMRDAVVALGGAASQINPLCPVELVIDHSVQVDSFGAADSAEKNVAIEYQRNQERYAFLRWGQGAFENFQVVPPGTGIVHQVNLEYLAQVVSGREVDGQLCAFPDTVVGTDSHTTMINGIGVLGWGVGGIEAEAAMLGQPISMLIPQVVGFRLTGSLPEGTTATDLVLVVVQMLRKKGVVGKFVEFFGTGLKNLPLSDRATLANMAPEYGATCGIFPVDDEVLRYLRLSGRDESQVALVESYYREQNMFHTAETPEASYSDVLSLDIGTIEPCISGPKRPQDRILLRMAKEQYARDVDIIAPDRETANSEDVTDGEARFELKDGAIVIAAITSCTNTSNPAVMLAAGMLARNAVQLGLKVKPWVKTSLAPGSRVVTDYLDKADVLDDLGTLGFSVVGYGCTTCIGNSGPLSPAIEQAIQSGDLVATSVLSGNRNFEGRIHARVKMNYLASPPLVVAYALAGRMDIDLVNDALGEDTEGNPVYLRDIWPSSHEIHAAVASKLDSSMFRRGYESVFAGDQRWQDIESPEGERFSWAPDSTYIRNPPYFAAMSMALTVVEDIRAARCLALLGDSITTDHISPAGAISPDSPAASYLQENGVERANFNSYGSRRGNHEVMMRGTFANIRLRNQLAPGTEGGWTRYQPDGEQMSIYDASMSYQSAGTPLLVIAGSEYGTGSSRDWAAKGTKLLGVSAVLCTSFERIHRSNLVGMGVLPLTFKTGEDATTLGLDGTENYDISGLDNASAKELTVTATNSAGEQKDFKVNLRLDTPKERDYVRHGGILHYVLRQLAAEQ